MTADLVYEGPVMVAVQTLGLFEDCKTSYKQRFVSSVEGSYCFLRFVDMPMRTSASAILVAWDAMSPGEREDPTIVARFVRDHFEAAGHELEAWTPEDWLPGLPKCLKEQDGDYRAWAVELNALWRVLGRRVRKTASSLTLQPGSVLVVPGGRFREAYYWDSFWIVQGLVVCGMEETAACVTRNLVGLLSNLGFVPNGSRSYYSDRSQPPVLSEMVAVVCEALPEKEAEDLKREAVPALDREYAYWTSGDRLVDLGDGHSLSRYHSRRNTPRPESYREDLATAAHVPLEDRARLYSDLASAAASGWDFSSRWMARTPETVSLARTATTSVIPVDLNAILLRMEGNLSQLHADLGHHDRSTHFTSCANLRRRAITAKLWHEPSGRWRDLWLDGKEPLYETAVLSDFTPVWAGLADDWPEDKQAELVKRALSPLLCSSGLRTSAVETGEQWDSPNCWPPLQWIAVRSLERLTKNPAALEMAATVKARYLKASHAAFVAEGVMHEKYHAERVGTGMGGEYEPQVGFGWSNGVALSFLAD